jgi:hypothetical protein
MYLLKFFALKTSKIVHYVSNMAVFLDRDKVINMPAIMLALYIEQKSWRLCRLKLAYTRWYIIISAGIISFNYLSVYER